MNSRIDYSNPPLKKLNLRANKLNGNVILGNFSVSWKFLFSFVFTSSANSLDFIAVSDPIGHERELD